MPPVPEGYDAWELCGWGGLKGEQSTPFAHISLFTKYWSYSRPPGGYCLGLPKIFYIRAIKHKAQAQDSATCASEIAQSALERQVGGGHYKGFAIQPVEFCQKNHLGYCESNVIKYVCRHGQKNGKVDLDKAIHYIQLLKEMEYPE